VGSFLPKVRLHKIQDTSPDARTGSLEAGRTVFNPRQRRQGLPNNEYARAQWHARSNVAVNHQ
ncbi:MAG TPA: hypothetical protein PKC12_06375, partial [Thiobacillaceae bacterium]|nr:hypothetical protein [Thiobacillaceae bacterium]